MLKAEKQHEIASIQQSIDQLKADTKKKKSAYDSIKTKLSIIKGRLIKMDRQAGEIVMSCEFKNVSKFDLDHYTLKIVCRSNSKKTLIFSSTQMFGGVKTLKPQDTAMQYINVSQYDMGHAPEVPWSTIKYPLTDPAQYNFNVEVYAEELKIDDTDYDLSTVNWSENDQEDYDKQIKDLQHQLEIAEDSKDNLDDIKDA